MHVSCIFVADGAKTWLQGEDSLEVEPWSAGCGSCGAKWCFVRWLQFGQNLEELAHGVRPGHADILVLEHEEIAVPRPGLFLPRSAQVQLGQFARYCGVTTGLFCPL